MSRESIPITTLSHININNFSFDQCQSAKVGWRWSSTTSSHKGRDDAHRVQLRPTRAGMVLIEYNASNNKYYMYDWSSRGRIKTPYRVNQSENFGRSQPLSTNKLFGGNEVENSFPTSTFVQGSEAKQMVNPKESQALKP